MTTLPPLPCRALHDGDYRLWPTITLAGRNGLRCDLAGKVASRLTQSQSKVETAGSPLAVIVGGGSCSGKTTVIENLLEQGLLPSGSYVHVNVQDIKQLIPEYHEIKNLGDYRADDVVHEESVLIAKQSLEYASEKKHNIVLETTMMDSTKTKEIINGLQDKGYIVRVVGIAVDPPTALDRNERRGRKTGKYVYDEALLESHKQFSINFEGVANTAGKAILYDNNSSPQIIALKDNPNEQLTPTDTIRYERHRNVSQRIRHILAKRENEKINSLAARKNRHLTNPTGRSQTPLMP